MKKIEVYDPPLCCPTGVCGPSVDPKLTRFAADLDWLKKKGVAVERFNLAQQPVAFAGNPVVRAELAAKGNACLPLVMADNTVVTSGVYPSRQELAKLAGIEYEPAGESLAGPVAGLSFPMANAGDACCPTPDGPPIEADGAYCPWPGAETNGGCC